MISQAELFSFVFLTFGLHVELKKERNLNRSLHLLSITFEKPIAARNFLIPDFHQIANKMALIATTKPTLKEMEI